jgi:hypothetical protein
MATRHKILVGLQFVFALFVLLGGLSSIRPESHVGERPDRHAREQSSWAS